MRLSPGATVERYVVEGLLGEGGMAAVYRVRHQTLGTHHALKVLTHPAAASRARLLLEGQVQARLDHPHLLPVQGILHISGHPCLLMPLIEGPSLRDLLAHHLPARAGALALLRAIAEGLAAAHARGVVHRDLKPGNVLLDLRLGRVQPRIGDFGLVKGPAVADAGLHTRTGMVLGTPAYAAPEQLRDARCADRRADIFSLGVLGAELLCGRRPFAGQSLPEIVEAHLAPPSLPGLDGPLAALLAEMLARDPAARPDAVEAVLARLPPAEAADLGARGPLFRAALALQHSALAPVPDLPSRDAGASIETDALLAPSYLEIAAAAAPPPGRLPAERTSCIGREAQVDEIVALLQGPQASARLVTVTGAGGIGKTRLALRVGHASRAAWPGGVWLCALADARDADGIQAGVRAALGVPSAVAVADALRVRPPLLLILDNLEQVVVPAAEMVAAWLDASPSLTVLATSRAPLRLAGEVLVPLEPLAPASAAALFVERAHAAGRRGLVAGDTAIAALVEQLDGLPLAIELAAARARALAPAQLLERLQAQDDRIAEHLLSSRGPDHPDRPDRQRTLRATLEWSWALLTPAEQQILARCAVFGDGLSLEAAEAILRPDADAETPWIEDVLADLVDKSLLVSGEGAHTGAPRLGMLRSIQRFAAAHLGADRLAVEQRHGAFFARLGTADALEALQQHGGVDATRALLDETANLWLACRRAVDRGDADVAALCARAVAWISAVQGPMEAGAALVKQVREALPLSAAQQADLLLSEASLSLGFAPADPHIVARLDAAAVLYRDGADPVGALRTAMVRAQHALRHPEEARQRYTDALAMARRIGHRRLEGEIQLRLAELALYQGELDTAAPGCRAALAILQEVGDRAGEGTALSCLSYIRRLQGDTDEALRIAPRALAILQEQGNLRGIAGIQRRIGQMQHDRGRYEEALAALVQARQICEDIGDMESLSAVLGRLVHLHRDRGQPEDARRVLEVDRALGRRLGNPAREANALNNLAGLAHDAGDYAEAIGHLEAAVVLYQAIGDPVRESTIRNNLGSALAATGQLAAAEPHVRAALDIAVEGGAPAYEVPFRATLADILSQQGQHADAHAVLDPGEALLQARPSGPAMVMLLTMRGTVALRAGEIARAQAACARAAVLLEDIQGGPRIFLRQGLADLRARLPP